MGVRAAIAAAGGAMALLLAGVALMLWAATAVAHWLLWAVPLAPLAGAAAALLWPRARRRRLDPAASVRQQIEADLQLLREIF